MVPFERALMISYRPSIVTLPLSLRISEALPLLCSSMPLFPTPLLVCSKFPHVPLRVCGWSLGYEERTCWANCCAISCQDFQPMWFSSTNVACCLKLNDCMQVFCDSCICVKHCHQLSELHHCSKFFYATDSFQVSNLCIFVQYTIW